MKTLAARLRENADQMDALDIDYGNSGPLLREAATALDKIEASLLRDSASKGRDGNIAKDHFVGQAILLCRSES